MSTFLAANRICSCQFKQKTNGSQMSSGLAIWLYNSETCHYSRAAVGGELLSIALWTTAALKATSHCSPNKMDPMSHTVFVVSRLHFIQVCLTGDLGCLPEPPATRKFWKLCFTLLLLLYGEKIHWVGSCQSGCSSSARYSKQENKYLLKQGLNYFVIFLYGQNSS